MSDIKAHLFPFSVDYEGPVKSKEYLQIEKIENEQYETVVMGRQLFGHSVSIHGNTQGHVWIKDTKEEKEEEEQMKWKKSNTIVDEFILWKKDRAPDKKDARIRAVENWLNISQAVKWHMNVLSYFNLITFYRFMNQFLCRHVENH